MQQLVLFHESKLPHLQHHDKIAATLVSQTTSAYEHLEGFAGPYNDHLDQPA